MEGLHGAHYGAAAGLVASYLAVVSITRGKAPLDLKCACKDPRL